MPSRVLKIYICIDLWRDYAWCHMALMGAKELNESHVNPLYADGHHSGHDKVSEFLQNSRF